MKILFLSLKHLSIPNWGTRLELMSDHLEKGDQIYVLRCSETISKCYSNFYHLNSVCFRCRLNFDVGIKILGIPKKNIFTLKDEITYEGFPSRFNDLEGLKKIKIYGVNFGLGVVSHLISEFRNHKFDVNLYQKEIFKTLRSAVLVYESVYELLQKLKPNLLYVWNGRFFDVWPAIEACRKLRINFCTYESCAGLSFSKYTLWENSLCHSLVGAKRDIENKWNNGEDDREKIGKSFYLNKVERVDLSSMTQEQRVGSLPECFDFEKTNVAIFSSSMDEYEAFEEYKNPIYKDENEGIRKVVEEFKDRKDIKFYLRVHPHLKGLENAQIQEIRRLDSLGSKNFKIIWPNEKIDSYALLKNCEKTISFGSTMGVEACFWGKPAILIGRAYFEDLDCCYIPKNHSEVIKFIGSKLMPKPSIGAIKYGNWMMNLGIPYKKYKPTTLTTGTFMGRDIWSEVGFKDKLKLKFLVLKDMGVKRIFFGKLKKYREKLKIFCNREG